MPERIYVLALQKDKYYVGKTKDVRRRISQHKRGVGARFTRKHKPIKLLHSIPVPRRVNANDMETQVTRIVAAAKGEANVRGGAFVTLKKPSFTDKRAESRHRRNACFKCGRKGHWASKCRVRRRRRRHV